MDESRISGIWWMSDDPDNRVAGDLIPAQNKLELNGVFEGIRTGVFHGGSTGLVSARQDKTILGMGRDSKRYTLEFFDDPTHAFSWTSFLDYQTETYKVGRIFKGGHFDRTDDLSFSDYYVEYPYLFEWVGESIISIDPGFHSKPRRNTVFLDEPKEIQFYDSEEFSLSFSIYAGGLQLSPPFKSVNVSQGCFLRLKPKKQMFYTQARAIIGHFERFIAAAIGKPIKPIRIEAKTDGSYDKVSIHQRRPATKDYGVIYPESMGFVFADIASNSQEIFGSWYQAAGRHEDAFNIYDVMRAESLDGISIENQFRDVVTAIEGYVTVEKARKKTSPDAAVKTLNEYIGDREERPIKASDYTRINVTRNKLSHLKIDPGLEHLVLDRRDKWDRSKKMLFLLEYAFLRDSGVSDAVLAELHKKRKLYF